MSKITSDHCITSSAVLEQMIKHAGNQKRKYPEANHDKPSGSGYKKMKSQKVLTKLQMKKQWTVQMKRLELMRKIYVVCVYGVYSKRDKKL